MAAQRDHHHHHHHHHHTSTLPSERRMLYGRRERGETGQLDTQYYTNQTIPNTTLYYTCYTSQTKMVLYYILYMLHTILYKLDKHSTTLYHIPCYTDCSRVLQINTNRQHYLSITQYSQPYSKTTVLNTAWRRWVRREEARREETSREEYVVCVCSTLGQSEWFRLPASYNTNNRSTLTS